MLQLAVKSDRDAVNKLASQVHDLHVSWRPDLFTHVAERYSEERFADLISHRMLYVARIGDAVVGYALLKTRVREGAGIVPGKFMVVEEVCVDEICRNQGIGKEIMTDVRALARAFGCDSLELSVYPQNDEAVAFYQRCGFTIRCIDMHAPV